MKTDEIRNQYLQFFEGKDHLVMPSAPLVPKNDPSLLLIGAGMAPLKTYFTGEERPPHPRIASCQKCMRTPDIERVGKTARHCTFFEMLGNFSFGDYFKEGSILWAWEFVTEVLRLNKKDLWITVYEEDEEAYAIWHEKVGVPKEKIVKLGKKDNFWEIGTGPCGPCSEIYFDRGKEEGCDSIDCKPGCECDRFLEFWNLVFTQYELDENGNYHMLKKKNIDTGMGLERMAVIMQNVSSVFEIDIIRPIVDKVSQITGIRYGHTEQADMAIRVITEHARGVTFMVSDGILPSNEGRGYVLRRLLRRAVRFGKILGLERSFLHEVAEVVIDIMSHAYPELEERKEFIVKVITNEEDRFQQTLNQGIEILQQLIKEGDEKIISGENLFKLYDTYGFPVELTQEIAEENNLKVDTAGFDRLMEEQRKRARAARHLEEMKSYSKRTRELLDSISDTEFKGYISSELASTLEAIIIDGELVETVNKGCTAELVFSETPFYAESGGQVGDCGTIKQDQGWGFVKDTKKMAERITLHKVKVEEGELVTGRKTQLQIDTEKRESVARNHTATHLLHYALRTVLGDHAAQSGSWVDDDLLRFDVSHFDPISGDELKEIARIVNKEIMENHKVSYERMSYEKAQEEGVLALFEGKYGEVVRVVSTGDVCSELCGGTHVKATGQIGLFKILNESSIGAGVRRIEAVTGIKALEHIEKMEKELDTSAKLLQVGPDKLSTKIKDMLEEKKTKDKEIEKLKMEVSKIEIQGLIDGAAEINGVYIASGTISSGDMNALRQSADMIREKLSPCVILIGGIENKKPNLIVQITKDIAKKDLHAGNLIKEMAGLIEGGGGGRADMAQAGGKKKEGLKEALDKGRELAKKIVKS